MSSPTPSEVASRTSLGRRPHHIGRSIVPCERPASPVVPRCSSDSGLAVRLGAPLVEGRRSSCTADGTTRLATLRRVELPLRVVSRIAKEIDPGFSAALTAIRHEAELVHVEISASGAALETGLAGAEHV